MNLFQKNILNNFLGKDSKNGYKYGKHQMVIPTERKIKVRNAIGSAIGLKITK